MNKERAVEHKVLSLPVIINILKGSIKKIIESSNNDFKKRRNLNIRFNSSGVCTAWAFVKHITKSELQFLKRVMQQWGDEMVEPRSLSSALGSCFPQCLANGRFYFN